MKGGGLKEKLQALGAQVASQATKVAAAGAKLVSQEVLGAQCLLDYAVGNQVASSNNWRIYTARAKKEGERWTEGPRRTYGWPPWLRSLGLPLRHRCLLLPLHLFLIGTRFPL